MRNARWHAETEGQREHVRHPYEGGWHNDHVERTWDPCPPGLRAFSSRIRTALFPQCFRPPTTVTKYAGETNPGLWLEDYRLACQAGGATDDLAIIRNLLLYLAGSARMWLEHLPANLMYEWSNLRKVFIGNFQEMYARPGNPRDLKNCRQRPG